MSEKWSSTDLKVPKPDFRSTPRSGHARERQLCATSGPSQLRSGTAPETTLCAAVTFRDDA
jgi:hypothetical protein